MGLTLTYLCGCGRPAKRPSTWAQLRILTANGVSSARRFSLRSRRASTIVVTRTSDADGKEVLETQETNVQIEVLFEATLNAKKCLWFYTPFTSPTEGPEPWKDLIADSMPTAIPIPTGTTRIDITVADPDIEWDHGPGTASKLYGYAEQQVDQKYYDFANPTTTERINRITSPVPKLNLLVGMLKYSGEDRYFQFPIGLSKTNIDAGEFSHLILGHHDGFEWKNNSVESVDVDVVFRAV